MSKYASKVVNQARAWLGCKESDGSHKKIIDIYNAHTPLARGYKVKYTDAWCATFVSAVAIACGCTDIIPTECGCGEMVKLFQKLGCWVEADDYAAEPGAIIFYDWQDTGTGDNTGWPDHVGIVESVSGTTITVIEGNFANSVKRRYLSVNGRNIRGYGVPRYEPQPTLAVKLPQLTLGSRGDAVKALQILLIGRGYPCGKAGAYGIFGKDTCQAVAQLQKDNRLEANGIADKATWPVLLGV